MTEDFVTRLERQLNEAERRAEHGGRLAYRLRGTARAWSPPAPVVVRVAIVLAIVAAVLAGVVALVHSRGERTVAPHAPAIIARVPVGNLYGIVPAYGSVWTPDADRGQLVRVDPAKRRVLARIGVGGMVTGIAPAAGALWAVRSGPPSAVLERIDPATNRVTASLPLPRAARVDAVELPHLHTVGGTPWVIGGSGALRIDPRGPAVRDELRWGLGGVSAEAFVSAGHDLWVHGQDGRLLLIDGATGARRALARSVPGRAGLAGAPDGGVIVRGPDGSVTRFDRTGRALWRSSVPADPTAEAPTRGVAVADDRIWVLAPGPASGLTATERLTSLDPVTGRVITSTRVPDTGADALVGVGHELWYGGQGGRIAVVRP